MFDFNINDYKSLPLLPNDIYDAVVVAAEQRDNKKSSGEHLYICLQVIHGKFAKRNIEHRFNLKNSNLIAQDIGRQQFSDFCGKLGIKHIKNPNELINKKCNITTEIEFNDKYGEQNKIVCFNEFLQNSFNSYEENYL